MPIHEIITGGQAGAEEGAWHAAELMGVPTGGTMPRNFETKDGARPDLALRFGAVQGAPARSLDWVRANAAAADVMLIITPDVKWMGSCSLVAVANAVGRDYFIVSADIARQPDRDAAVKAGRWLEEHGAGTVCVAGAGGAPSPEMAAWACEFIRLVLEYTQVEKPVSAPRPAVA